MASFFQKIAEEYFENKIWTNDTRVRNEGVLRNHVYGGESGLSDNKKVEWF